MSTWLREHGFADAPTSPTIPTGGGEAPCPDGLARCRGGAVSVSRAFTPPSPCSPEGCRCPWDQLAACRRGCVVEGLEIEMPRESAEKQLCAPDPGAVFARPAGSAQALSAAPDGKKPGQPQDDGEDPDPDIVEAFCEVERYHCARGVVHHCDSGQAKPVAVCEGGCIQGEGLIVEDVSIQAATALLCAR